MSDVVDRGFSRVYVVREKPKIRISKTVNGTIHITDHDYVPQVKETQWDEQIRQAYILKRFQQ